MTASCETNGADDTREARGPLRFAGLVLDLSACTLARESGEAIPLTRGEFSLLRLFVSRPGRTLSREAILNGVADRPLEPFDRSVDVLVGRLRRKIEPDPKAPSLIVTVPGEGYRFDGLAIKTANPSPEKPEATGQVGVPAARAPPGFLARLLPGWIAPVVAGVVLALVATVVALKPQERVRPPESVVAVQNFVNLGGGEGDAYFGVGVAETLRTILSTFPGIRVLSEALPPLSAHGDAPQSDFVLRGAFLKTPEKVRVTAQLSDVRSGENVWADRFDSSGDNVIALQETIANRIYDSVAGFEGSIRNEEVRNAWRKSAPSLSEYDYVLRGEHYIMRPTCDDQFAARKIFEEGLGKHPQSALLRVKLAFTYTDAVEFYCSSDPSGDIERAWLLAKEALASPDRSRLTDWLGHWLMMILYQWRDRDFERSVGEAEAALRLVPYDARLRSGTSFYLANAGRFERAVELSAWAMKSPGGTFACLNLAWAYYLMGKNQEAREVLERRCDPTLPGYQQQLAAVYVRLGRLDDARAVMRKWMSGNPKDSIAFETTWPIKPDLKSGYAEDLRKAGMPE